MLSILKSRVVLGTLLVVLILGGVKTCQIMQGMAAAANQQMPPTGVSTFVVEQRELPTLSRAVASLSPVQGAMLSAEEAGKVATVQFESGSRVEAGAILVQLDTAVEEAQLRAATAQADLAQISLRRIRSLRPTNASSQADLDSALATARQTDAEVDALKAQIQRKTIVAPFAGIAGIRRVNPGDFVSQGAPVVPLQAMDQLYADFSLPQHEIGAIKVDQPVALTIEAFPNTTFEAKISAVDSQIDANTRTFKVRAVASNAGGQLRPGMFAQATVTTGSRSDVLVIPVAAIAYAPYGNSVYVVEQLDDGKGGKYTGVEQRIIQTGASHGDLAEVISGLKAGEKIVSSGAFKLMPKMAVIENNSITPGTDVAPKVENT